MLNEIFKNTLNEIKFGYLKRKHPNKYCYLSSVLEDKPMIRTVVLRDMTEDYNLIIFTDKRSSKVEQFIKNSNAKILFYNHKKLWQIKVCGRMHLLEEQERVKYYQQKIQGNSKKDYTTQQKPSSVLKNPNDLEYGEDMHFAVLELKPQYIESLQLKRPNHIRCIFRKDDEWQGEFLVP